MKSNWNLEQACAIVASDDCRGQSLLHVILETLKAPRTASFQQLLSLPKIRELQNRPETLPYFNVINLFAHGCYSDYKAAGEGLYPPLTPGHKRKLKMLSLLTLGSNNRMLPYDMLQAALDIPNVADLEQLVIDSLYDGNIDAKLDQANKCARIMRVEARDVHSSQKAELISCLQSWLTSCENYQSKLERLAIEVEDYSKAKKEQQKEVIERIEKSKKEFSAKHASRGEGPSSEFVDHDIEMMDEPIQRGHSLNL